MSQPLSEELLSKIHAYWRGQDGSSKAEGAGLQELAMVTAVTAWTEGESLWLCSSVWHEVEKHRT